MTPWSTSLAAVALVSAIPMAAMLLLSWQQSSQVQHRLPRLVPIAAGALLGASVFHLIPESLSGAAEPLRIAGIVALGLLSFLVVDRVLHRRSAPMVAVGPSGSSQIFGDVIAMQRARQLMPLTMAGDALHNVVDGMLIAAAFMDNPSLGLLTGGAIALHELPRELGTFAILVRGGTGVGRALLFNALTAAGAVGGAVATLAIGTQVAAVGTALVPFAAGNFLYLGGAVALSEFQGIRGRADGWIKAGMALMGLLLTSAPLWH